MIEWPGPMMKKPLSALQFRALSLLLILAGLALVMYWVAGRRGLFLFFFNRHLGPPEQNWPIAAGLCFICGMLPMLIGVIVLRTITDMPSLGEELRQARHGAGADPKKIARARHWGRSFGIAGGGAVLGAFIRAGFFEAWFGDPGAWSASGITAGIFALAAGFSHAPPGRRLGLGALYSLAFGIFGMGAVWVTYKYLEMRPEPFTFEFILPLFIGGLPGGALVGAVSLLEDKNPST